MRAGVNASSRDGALRSVVKERPDLPSGKFQVRLPRHFHKRLADAARDEGVSINALLISTIAEALGERATLTRVRQGLEDALADLRQESRRSHVET